MAHLTKATKYDIADSNIALLGSDLEKRVREHSGDKEASWDGAGAAPGLQVWRVEHFHIVPWPKERLGSFYDGDSYIVLHTYKKDPKAEALSYDIHFWLGKETTQDEAGTAAYKTVELDDHLNGVPVQYREAEGAESPRFRSYFPRLLFLRGGASTGFHHVSSSPPPTAPRLYLLHGAGVHLVVREAPPTGEALASAEADVFVLDRGTRVVQFNARRSAGKERFAAAEFVRTLAEGRGSCDVSVVDEGGSGSGTFLKSFGVDTLPPAPSTSPAPAPRLFRISDSSGTPSFTPVTDASPPRTPEALDTADAYLLDAAGGVFVWLGAGATLAERRLALQYAQGYLHEAGAGRAKAVVVVMRQGRESEGFLIALRLM